MESRKRIDETESWLSLGAVKGDELPLEPDTGKIKPHCNLEWAEETLDSDGNRNTDDSVSDALKSEKSDQEKIKPEETQIVTITQAQTPLGTIEENLNPVSDTPSLVASKDDSRSSPPLSDPLAASHEDDIKSGPVLRHHASKFTLFKLAPDGISKSESPKKMTTHGKNIFSRCLSSCLLRINHFLKEQASQVPEEEPQSPSNQHTLIL